MDLLSKKKIDASTAGKQINSIENNRARGYGTAIFAKYHGRHFLISARHVLWNEASGDSMAICPDIVLVENFDALPNDTSGTIIVDRMIDSAHPVKGKIGVTPLNGSVRVLNFSFVSDTAEIRSLSSLRNTDKVKDYFFSSSHDDIGIIDLDTVEFGNRFLQTLAKRGYVPIEISDVDTICRFRRLDPILCMGFPAETEYDITRQSWFRSTFEADLKSISMTTEGFIVDNPPESNYFEAAIFTYHGFSGGPVIRNNKLIGVVQGATYHIVRNPPPLGYSVLMHSQFIKASFIYQMLKEFTK